MISKNLILRYINGHTSEEETKEVVEWIKASEEKLSRKRVIFFRMPL